MPHAALGSRLTGLVSVLRAGFYEVMLRVWAMVLGMKK